MIFFFSFVHLNSLFGPLPDALLYYAMNAYNAEHYNFVCLLLFVVRQ